MGALLSFLAAASALRVRAAVDTVTILVLDTPLSQPIPSDAVGLSYEVSIAPGMLGFAQNGARATFVHLMQTLALASGASGGPGGGAPGLLPLRGPGLRIGGDSTDGSAYVPGNGTLPAGVGYRITDADLQSYGNAVSAWNGSVTLGLDFRFGANASLGVAHAAAAARVLGGAVRALEIGNEPDLYFRNGIRAGNYTREAYAAEWASYLDALRGGGGVAFPVQGGTFCCNETGFDLSSPALLQAVAADSGRVNATGQGAGTWSEHFYPLNAPCFKGQTNSVWQLLADDAARGRAQQLAQLAADAAALGVPFVLGEMNSVACGGQANVSDVFASALWAVDAMLWGAVSGVSGFRFHTGDYNGPYSPIGLGNANNPHDTLSVRPLFYGMWAFAQAAGGGARVVSAPYTASNPLIKAWALRSEVDGTSRVVVLHKDGNATGPAAVTVTPEDAVDPSTVAQLAYLLPNGNATAGPTGVFAVRGLSFGNLTFDGNTHGIPLGPGGKEETALHWQDVPLTGANAAFRFQIPPAAIALLRYASPAGAART